MSNKAPLTPTFPDVMENFRKDLLYRLYCHLPGEIVAFSRTKLTATVKVGLKQVIPDYAAPTGSQLKNYPVLTDVPVFTLQGGGGSIGADPVAGDPCLLCVLDRNIDAWYQNGGQQAPLSPRAHDLSDAFCFVGFNPLVKPIVSARAAGETGIADALAAIIVKNGKASIRNGPLPANNLNGILAAFLNAVASDAIFLSTSPAVAAAAALAVTELAALLE